MGVQRGPGEGKRDKLGEAGRVILRSPALVKTVEWLIRLLLGAALAGGQVLGDASPFGVAMVGACGAGAGGVAALLGSVAGYVVCRGLEEGLRYAAACILTFSVAFAFYDAKVYGRKWFMPASAALMNGCAGLVVLTAKKWTAALAAGWLGEMALTAVGAYFFRCAFSAWEGREEEAAFSQRAGVLLLGAAVLISLADLKILGLFSVGRLCAVYAVVTAAWSGGMGAGCPAGIAIGLAMDLTGGGAPFYTMAYGFVGPVCGLTRRRKRRLCATAGILAVSLLFLWCWERGGPLGALYEGMTGAFLFLITPQGLLDRMAGVVTGKGKGPREEEAAEWAADKLRATAGAFSDLFAALKTAFWKPEGEGEEDPSVIFDRAANRVCVKCPMRDRCWQTGYTDTHGCLVDALPAILKERRAESGMFPARFRDRCIRLTAFVSGVDRETAAYFDRARYRSGVEENRRAVCRQYGDVAQVLEETVEAMNAVKERQPRARAVLTATVGVAGRTREGQTVSGDAGGWFRREDGTLCLILCDGMGSGPEARRESDMTLRLLEKFLRAGIRPDLALRTLNEALALRGEETGSFSTIDLMTLDLETGRAALYKLGAAPSYLRRGGCVTRLSGGGLPAGLTPSEGREPDRADFRMGPGDSLVLVTDGVIGEGDRWLRERLGAFEEGSPKTLAEELVARPGEDDRTAIVMRLGLREEE